MYAGPLESQKPLGFLRLLVVPPNQSLFSVTLPLLRMHDFGEGHIPSHDASQQCQGTNLSIWLSS